MGNKLIDECAEVRREKDAGDSSQRQSGWLHSLPGLPHSLPSRLPVSLFTGISRFLDSFFSQGCQIHLFTCVAMKRTRREKDAGDSSQRQSGWLLSMPGLPHSSLSRLLGSFVHRDYYIFFQSGLPYSYLYLRCQVPFHRSYHDLFFRVTTILPQP